MIEFRHLRHLLALAEHGNFGRAAAALCITQPALSRSIHALEKQVGSALFDRSRSGVEPTEMGRLLLRHASSLDADVRDLDRDIRLAKGLELGELRIGAGAWGGAALVGPVIGLLNALHPRLRVRLAIVPWKELAERARTRDVDIVVGVMQEIKPLDAFEVVEMSVHDLIVVCRVGHPLTAARAVAPADVFGYPFVGAPLPDDMAHTLRRLAQAAPRRAAMPAELLTIECDSARVLKDLLPESDAVTSMPRFMVEADLQQRRLAEVPGLDLGLRVRFGAAWLRGRSTAGAGAKFLELLHAHDAGLAARDARHERAARRPAGAARASGTARSELPATRTERTTT